MNIEFKLPDLGEGIHEAEILAIKIVEGQLVSEDEPLCEVETDKAVVEIPSPVAGHIGKIHMSVGDIVTVGSIMITFSVEAEVPAGTEKKAPAEKIEALTMTAIKAAEPAQPAHKAGNGHGSPPKTISPVAATPATRRVAREMGVDLNLVRGSGPGGRVLKEDVHAYAQLLAENVLTSPPVASPVRTRLQEADTLVTESLVALPAELPHFEKYGPVERVALRSIRRKIAVHMAQSWAHIPHVTHFEEADISELNAFLKRQCADMAEHKPRLTLTVIVLKAVVSALRKYRQFNSSLDERTGEIIYKHYYNIGIAVATDRGLIVPVIRDVDHKNLRQLADELNETAQKTRLGKIELDKLQGGTFTITNIGAIGGTATVPMVNFPEAAILGVARAQEKPIVREHRVEIGTVLPLSLSFDHRIADGAEAAYFVRHVADFLEEPLQLLLEE